MDPNLYAALPPDKKEEYKKLFPEPTIDYAMSTIRIDDCIPIGYAFIGDQRIKLPDAQTYTLEKSEPFDLGWLKSAIDEVNNSLRVGNLIREFIFMDRFKVQIQICANDLSFCRLFFEKGY